MARSRASKTERQLDALATELQQSHQDPLRVDLVRCAQRFKRSWVELAEALVRVRDTAAYERWGYPNLHSYCTHELQIKPATVDKLVLSFTTLERHAPQVLRSADLETSVPSYQAIHYFARNVDDGGSNGAAEDFLPLDPDRRAEALDALHHAVFEEGQPIAELRRRFDPLLRPKPAEALARDALHKLKTATQKVSELLVQVEGIPQQRVEKVETALDALRKDLDTLLATNQEARTQHDGGEVLPMASARRRRT